MAIRLNVTENTPYYIGARAYVTQTADGAILTVVDKEGVTTATILNGINGRSIASCTLNENYTLTILYTDGTSDTTTSIRGAQGVSGVWVGDEAPSNPDYNVWVDPTNEDGAPFCALLLRVEPLPCFFIKIRRILCYILS